MKTKVEDDNTAQSEKTDLEVQKEMYDLELIARQGDGKVAYLRGRDNVAIFDRRGNHKVTVSMEFLDEILSKEVV